MQGKQKARISWKLPAAILFWVAVWQAASMLMHPVLMPSPFNVLKSFIAFLPEPAFWKTVGSSLLRIGSGFFIGFIAGCFFAGIAAFNKTVEILLQPVLILAKAAPVASFAILALLWFSSGGISTFISLLLVFPVVYSGVLTGIRQAPEQMLQMAKVFRLSPWKRFYAIYLPAIKPTGMAAVQLALGLCWKSGVAAEVIGVSPNSLGRQIYEAKVALRTDDVFAWTFVVILLSWFFSKVVVWMLNTICVKIEKHKNTTSENGEKRGL